MSTTTRFLTAEELLQLPDDDRRYELVRGVLEVNPPPGGRHGSVGMRIGVLLSQHVHEHRLGVVMGEVGFVLARNPDTVRAPDVAFIRKERVPAGGLGPGYVDGAPDLAVEVLSPSDRSEPAAAKVEEYLDAGGRLVWLVDPQRECVTEHRPLATPRVLREGDVVDGGDVVPGFARAVRDLFHWPE